MARSFLFVLLLIAPLSFSISDYTMLVSLDESGVAHFVSEAAFPDSADEKISFCFSGNFNNPKVYDRSGLSVAAEYAAEGNFTCVSATVPVDYLKIVFDSQEFTSKKASAWDFETRMYSSEDIDSFACRLALPAGSVLTKTNGAVESSAASLLVSWNAENVTALKRFNMSAGYRIAEAQQDLGGVFLAAAFLVLAVASYLSYRKRFMPQKPGTAKPEGAETKAPKAKEADWLESNEVFRTLDEVDKEIVREIARQKGKTTQAKIYLNTHIPKATLSRRLASLQNRGVLRKSQKGNRNLVTLAVEKK